MNGYNSGKSKTKLADVLDYGQADDRDALEVLQAFQQFTDGYYRLCSISDVEWWEWMNQSTMFNEIMEEQWDKLNKIDFMSIIGKMEIALAGAYVRFSPFVDGVTEAFENGCGFRGNYDQEKSS